MQIPQVLFLMDMLKSWLDFIFFFDYEFSVPNKKKKLTVLYVASLHSWNINA